MVKLFWSIAGVVVVAMIASSCIMSGLGVPGLTPVQTAQVKAMNEAGLDVYLCFQIAGPPPAGGFTMVGVPQGKSPTLTWGGNCQPIQAAIKAE